MSVCCKNIKIGGSPCDRMLNGRKDTEGIQLNLSCYSEYILTDPSGLFLRLASQLFMSHPLLLKSGKDTQHLYKSKLTSFSNLHSAFSPGTREAGNKL